MYSVENASRAVTMASSAWIAGNSAQRRQGLLKKELFQMGEALWIAPCEAIHTIGMRWPIDVVFLDRAHRICKVVRKLAPWRMAACLKAASVLELPAGVLNSTGTQAGDVLVFRRT